MSLLNQVLKDLEKRRDTQEKESPLSQLNAPKEKKSQINIVPALLNIGTPILLVLALFTIFWPTVDGNINTVPHHRSAADHPQLTARLSLTQQPVLKNNDTAASVADDFLKNELLRAATTLKKEIKPATLLVNKPASMPTSALSVVSQGLTHSVSVAPAPVMQLSIQPAALPEAADNEKKYADALKDINANDESQAIKKLKDILQNTPTFQLARETLVTLLIKKEDFKIANKMLREGLRLTPNYVPFVKLKVRILMENGDYQSALSAIQAVSPLLSEDPEYYVLLALLQQNTGHPIRAAQTYEQLLHYNPDQSVWWMGLGIALESANQPSAATEAYKQALNAGQLSVRLRSYVKNRIQVIQG